ncbi:MAG: type II toxin-antitoxin system VapC family toxin [Balneolaceae bacterium]|nr:type II toxin-antitoxin system VapC family toxin [Balneolaceae bacterium]
MSSSFVIDTSVAVKWLFLEEGSSKSEVLLEQISFFFVPSLFLIELDAVITKKVRKKEITSDEALQKYEKRKTFPYRLVEYPEISRLAVELSVSLPVTLYDAAFIATAIEKNGNVYTADQRLVNGVSNTSLDKYVRSIWDL